MIWRRSPSGVRRLSALAAALGVLGGGCVVAGTHGPAGGAPAGAPETSAVARGTTVGAGDGGARGAMPQTGCSVPALQLIGLVNAYRAENGLPSIPASPSLCTVALAHARDLADHAPHAQPGCNLHSWSARGEWTPCCYTPDHAQKACMWNKPRELTAYRGNGYETAFEGSSSPEEAMRSWRSSPAHDAVILNRDIWGTQPWRAVGAGVHGGFILLWFGEEADPVR